ncbi:MAG: hypothetical protein J0H15_10130 [Xanthomonadales bacterium]|nr:hypothetical protein [Xanthomonadales bacterium]
MNLNILTLARRLALAVCLTGSAFAWAGPTEAFWHDLAARSPAAGAPQPAEFRLMSLDRTAAANHLRDAFHQGIAVEIALPEPNGGFTDFLITNSGTLPPELQAKYPDILSFKGKDAQGRRVRVDVSPLGFQAMVFDPAGVWVVRPETFGSGDAHLVFRRSELQVPGGTGTCEVHDSHVDPSGLNLSGHDEPMTQTGVTHRLYRTAVAANNRYIAAVGGGTVAGGLAATTTAMNRVTEVYEYEMSIQLTLVPNNDLLMFPDAANDPFSSNGTGVINNSTSIINSFIGEASYDIGHVFTTGSGGVAGLRVVCGGAKARGTTGLPNPTGDAFYIDFVAHEMGHQFGGNHPFNGSLGNCSGGNRNGSTAYEPGSGSTIQSYAGICSGDDLQPHSDPFFHAISLQEITNFTENTSTGGSCSANTPNPNRAPVIDTASLTTGYTIPARTPFFMSGVASDPDGDAVKYSWEEWDLGPQAPLSAGDNGSSPIFRSWPPKDTGVRLFPTLSTILGGPALKGETLPTTNRTLKFRLTARDLVDGNGASQSSDVSITVNNTAGPFKVNTPAAGASWGAGQSQSVTWDVAGTNAAPISCASVDIDLSSDGGNTWSASLASNVPNSGNAIIVVPSVTTSQARVRVSCANNIFFNVSPANFSITPGTGSYTVGGTVSGLLGSGLSLKLNGDAALPIAGNGAFTFPTTLAAGSVYSVTVATQPTAPAQVCTVSNGSGTIGTGNVTNVQVNCAAQTSFRVGGTVMNLTGTGLKLRLNSGSNLAVNSNGPFQFTTPLADGDAYTVSITAQPAGQTCVVQNGSGTIAGANVTDVVVDCNAPVATYTVGGTVSGLAGDGLALMLNGSTSLPVSANGSFVFPGGLPGGASYAVTVATQPTGPTQTCSVANGSGTIGSANVTDVAVTCVSEADDVIFADGFDAGELACAPQQLFQDPSFEATVDYENPYWDSDDSLGGTSFCDDACDDGGTFVARTGEWFVWMGGWDEANTADLSQSVVFPAGQPRFLNYWMVNQIGGDATASLRLLIDGTVVQNLKPSDEASEWERYSFQIPAQYLDGQAHEVKFDWSASAPGGDIGGVMMDDMTLDCDAGPAARVPARAGQATRKRMH